MTLARMTASRREVMLRPMMSTPTEATMPNMKSSTPPSGVGHQRDDRADLRQRHDDQERAAKATTKRLPTPVSEMTPMFCE